MGKANIKTGHATIEDFAYWINERHSIWTKRFDSQPKPWTDDPILQHYKFTNVFRELDKGTVALRQMVKGSEFIGLILFNVFWYRMFNRYEHATDIGFVSTFGELKQKLKGKELDDEPLFTSAHMTVGRAGEAKVDTTLQTLERVYKERFELADDILACPTLEGVFRLIRARKFYGIGPFICYEIVTDLRHYHKLWHQVQPADVLTWVNIGPGCRRGLRRLGSWEPDLTDVRQAYNDILPFLSRSILCHVPVSVRSHMLLDWEFKYLAALKPYFELREIEHSLCEFDKYQRVKTGAGRPRERYDGFCSH